MKSIRIRILEVSDVDDIVRIYSAIVRRAVDDDFKESLEKQARIGSEQAVCYVAADNRDNVVGFMMGHILVPGFGIERSAWIAVLGVDPGYMGRDIGKLLADKLFKYFKSKGIKRVHTSVLWDSTDVLSFFKAVGFSRSRFVELQKDID